jgi:hypothetical protein
VHAAGLSAQAVDQILIRVGERANRPCRLAGHNLRAGLVTEARRAGANLETTADQGRWVRGSRALYEYIRRVDQWRDNPLTVLGL